MLKFVEQLLKYLTIYSIFILSVFLLKIPIYSYYSTILMPELSIIILFILCFVDDNRYISYFNIFLLGIVFDSLTLMPIGSTSFCYLLSCKLTRTFATLFLDNNSFFGVVKNFAIFTFIFYFIKIILNYVILNYDFNYLNIVLLFFINIIYFMIILFLYNKIYSYNINRI